jgi:mycothiol synthase
MLTMRPYKGEPDLAAMQDLLSTTPNPFEPHPTAADLPEMLNPTVSDTPANTAVWEDASGVLLGFAIVSQYNNLHFHFRPGSLTKDAEQEMMDWAIARMRLRMREQRNGEPLTLDASARDDDAAKVAFLERHGFVPTDIQTVYMLRSLHEPFPEPQLPPGFVLRPLAGEREVETYVTAHRAAYGTEQMTVELRLAIIQEPYYRPELDLVAIAPDGTLAAFCLCSIDEAENEHSEQDEGRIDIVGTRPEFRNQGLGRAMVLAGMRALKEQGMDIATLSTLSSNTGAIGVYQVIGFQRRFGKRWYEKVIA